MSDLAAFTRALTNAADPAEGFAALCTLSERTVGHTLFTLMTFDRTHNEARRIYSSRPEAYPVSGTKPTPANAWADQVLRRHEPFVANTIEAIADFFPDHALIASLGCGSILNLPVVAGGEALGTINCLHAARHYTPERVAASAALSLPGVACFLFHLHRLDKGGP